jgi:hypothetical protein
MCKTPGKEKKNTVGSRRSAVASQQPNAAVSSQIQHPKAISKKLIEN